MSNVTGKADVFLDRMAAHVLKHGLGPAALDGLAEAAGTSWRMLDFQFGSRDMLVAALLDRLVTSFTHMLETAVPPARAKSRDALFAGVLEVLRHPGTAPFTDIWMEIVAYATRGDPIHLDTATAVIEAFEPWVAARLPEDDPDPKAATALLLAAFNGALILDRIELGRLVDEATQGFGHPPNQEANPP